MAKLLKLRRGTTSQHSSFTGAEGEVTVDTDKETLVVHDGSTAGGFPVARADSPDSQKVRFGTGNDLEIFHDGSNSWVSNTTGDLNLKSTGDDVVITAADDVQILLESSENGILAKSAGAVEIYYDGAKKFETNSVGAQWFGDLKGNDNQVFKVGTGNDLQIYHDGSDTYIQESNSASDLFINSNKDLTLKIGDGSGGYHTAVYADSNGAVRLYHDDAKKLETTAAGATVTGAVTTTTSSTIAGATFTADVVWDNGTHAGNDITWDESDSTLEFADGVKASFGNDLIIGHDTATHTDTSLISSTADLYVSANKVLFTDSNNATAFTVDSANDFIHLADSHKIKFGTGNDLEIYHSGGENFIRGNASASRLYIDCCEELHIRHLDTDGSNSENMIKAKGDGAVELYYNNNKKLETVDGGIQVWGAEGNDAVVYLSADESDEDADDWKLNAAAAGGFFLENKTSGSWETNIKAVGNGGVELYYNNTLTCYTSNGCLSFPDSQKIYIGEGNDLQLYHDASGGHSFITSITGNLYIQTDEFRLRTVTGTETMIQSSQQGDVQLYYDNSKKFNTNSGGCKIHGDLQFDDDDKIELGNDDDLKLYHGGTHSWITNDTGTLVIESDQIDIRAVNNEHYIEAVKDGSLKLYFDNSTKLETSNTGITVTGAVTPSSGIYIGGSGGGNHLDDYEEGTWTPDPHDGSCSHSNSRYTKVGRQVTCWTFLSSFSDTSTNDQIKIKDLPFAPANDMMAGSAMCSYSNDVSCVHALVDTSSRITFFGNNSGSYSQYRHNEINNASAQIKLVVTYDVS